MLKMRGVIFRRASADDIADYDVDRRRRARRSFAHISARHKARH